MVDTVGQKYVNTPGCKPEDGSRLIWVRNQWVSDRQYEGDGMLITRRTIRTNVMPVSIDAFECDETLSEPSVGERVIAYLATNHDTAFKRSEIAAAIDADANAVGSALTRLKRRGLVRHRQHYWAVTDHRDRLRAAYDVHALFDSLAAAEDEKFDRAAWLQDATPIEEYHTEETNANEDG